jgi:hypothetical protein
MYCHVTPMSVYMGSDNLEWIFSMMTNGTFEFEGLRED